MRNDSAAACIGLELENGWVIEDVRPRCVGATGACHSFGLTAKHSDGRRAFVKVLDPAPDPTLEGNEQLKELERRLAVFNYENDLLNKCLSRGISRVVRALGRGSFRLPDFSHDVHYLMFELAERDLREHATLEMTFHTALNMQILHQVALGLEALHFNQIAHQDLKPSNVLLFGDSFRTKLGDLGHAHDRTVPRPGINGVIAGDPGHAAPEQLFGYHLEEWTTRRLSSDLYLLGSLVVYMFTNVSLTAQISGQLRPEHHWEAWSGKYTDALPYVRDAWDAVIEEFTRCIDQSIRDELTALTRYLTDPEPERRGHPRNRAANGPTYGVRRFSSRFEVMAKRADWLLTQRTV